MGGQHARRLTRHYALLLGALAVPLLLLVIALAVQQFAGQRRALLDELAGRARAERIALQPVLRAAADHVRGLREFAEDRLNGRLPQPESPLRRWLAQPAHDNGMSGVHLDAVVATPLEQRIGNVLADRRLLDRPPAEMVELDQALDMFAPMRLAHIASPQLRWSYYFSAQGDLLTMFPFAPSADFVALGDYSGMRELIAGWLGLEVFAAGTPARDPDRIPYWTPVYRDAGGAGLMVSHAAPVYAGDRFMGVVGTDILLSHLDQLLRGVEWPLGTALIVNDAGQVLASSGAEVGTGPPATIGEVLPASLAQVPMTELLGRDSGFRQIAGHSVLTERLANSPFSLLYLVSDGDLTASILPRFKPYALILAGLMLALLAAHFLLQSRFVHPALRLVRHIQNESDGISTGIANIPEIWRPWFATVSQAFATGRDYQSRLEASEARLKAAAASIPDGLAIFDAEDRLAFFNSRYPDHLAEPVRATLALGKRWSDWGREAMAQGPIYHPDMGADYLERRAADRGLGMLDREHRLIDGRWVRVRESRMPDGGRVLLTSDTTAEHRDRQERALVATAMAQVGNSIEITDADYRLLYVNPAFTELTGYTAEEVLGRTPGELLRSGAHGSEFYAEIDEATRAGRVWKGRIVSRHKSGRLIHQEATISPVFDESGALSYFVAAKRDIAERMRVEEALRASEARFLAAAASIPDGLVILDREDRIAFFNNRHPELLPPALREGLALGVRFEDWIREGLARGPIYHPDMGPDYAARRLASRDEPLTEREHQHVDGRWVRIREARMPDGGRVLLTTDITDRRDAEARLLAAAESIPDGLAIFDADDRFVFFNSRYPGHLTSNLRQVLRLGLRFEEWIEQGLALGEIYHPDMGPDFAAYRLALRQEERSEHEHKISDGRWVRIRESRMADGGRVLLTTDVTERRRRRQQLSLLAMAVDQVGDAVEITDAQGRFTYVNPAFVKLTGFSASEVAGRRPQDVLTSDSHDAEYFTAMERCLKDGSSWQGLIVNRRKNGDLVYQDTTISPLRDPRGHITHYVAVKRDVTEQERAEAALRASETRYRALIETQTEFVLRQLPEGRLTFVNEAYCRYVGLQREFLLSDRFNGLDMMVPEDRPRFELHLRGLTPAHPTAVMETRAILPNGEQRWERWVDTGIFDADGRLLELQSTGRDITEQKNGELALRASEERYRAVVEGQTEFILRLDPTGILTFVNDAYCRYRGKPRAVLMAGFNDVDHYPPEQQARIRAAWASLSPQTPSVTYELVKPCADHGQCWEEWTDTAAFGPDGRLVEIQAIGRDITARKLAEQDLVESQARFQLIAESVPLPIAITAVDRHCVLFANAKGREVFGVEAGC